MSRVIMPPVFKVPRLVNAVRGRDMLKLANKPPSLKSVASVKLTFCPWKKNTESIKSIWCVLNTVDCRSSNRKCNVTTVTQHDDSKPLIQVVFNDGEKLTMKSEHLKFEELSYHFNAFCHHKEETMEAKTEALF